MNRRNALKRLLVGTAALVGLKAKASDPETVPCFGVDMGAGDSYVIHSWVTVPDTRIVGHYLVATEWQQLDAQILKVMRGSLLQKPSFTVPRLEDQQKLWLDGSRTLPDRLARMMPPDQKAASYGSTVPG